MALGRPISFPDIGFGDQDQDGNTALLELDRGLKSTKTGEQCEAISKFPTLFEKYPFPILINSALLKLAEVFRQETPGSNFVRVCVVEVVESCGRHLDKLINVDEFLRRITAVMHSNDPLARALTLRTLGWMSGVVGENRQVHHLIREALDAKESVELQAAIMAAEKYAAKSKTFAMNMCERLIHMIGGLATPVDVKLQLIRVFQHMHHDAETAATVRSLCLELLKEFPTQRVVITTLHTLTNLAAHILVDIPQQVDLLMGYLSSEARLHVRQAVLGELGYLAEAAPHAWSSENVETLVDFTRASRHNAATTTTALAVLSSLTAAPALPRITLTPESAIIELCRECVYDSNINVACKALQLFTNIAIYMHEEQQTSIVCEEAHSACLSLLQSVVSATQNDESSTVASNQATTAIPIGLRTCLVCADLLAKTNPNIMSDLAITLTDMLCDNSLSTSGCALVAEALASLGGSRADVLTPHLASIIEFITKLLKQAHKAAFADDNKTRLVVTLVTLVLQTFHGHQWSDTAEAAVGAASKSVNQWATYRMARQASRYGHHKLAHGLYGALCSRVCSDQQHFWLSALAEISWAESRSQAPGDRADNLTDANSHLHKALSALKAASSSSQPLRFVQEYVRLRAETFLCHAQLLHACLSLRTAPPPAIAASLASSTRDDLLRCGRVSQQLGKSARDFHLLGSQYGTLYQSVFDADPQTLCNIALLQQGAILVAQGIELITRPSTGQVTDGDIAGPDLTTIKQKLSGGETVETQTMITVLEEATTLLRRLAQVTCEVKAVREQHLQVLQSISAVLLSGHLPYPRCFFQTLQRTTITLALLPQPRTPGDPIAVQTSSQLAVKVEGVIGHGRNSGLFRSVSTVILTVNSVIQNRPQHTMDMKVEPNETLTQTVEPHNDFFAAQFLLGFPIPGLYQVTVDAAVMDESDDLWQTGPRHTLNVKSQEDPASKAAAQQQTRQQVPPATYGGGAGTSTGGAPAPPPGVTVLPTSQPSAQPQIASFTVPRPAL